MTRGKVAKKSRKTNFTLQNHIVEDEFQEHSDHCSHCQVYRERLEANLTEKLQQELAEMKNNLKAEIINELQLNTTNSNREGSSKKGIKASVQRKKENPKKTTLSSTHGHQ